MSESSLLESELSALFARCGGAFVVVAPESWRVLFVSDRYLELAEKVRSDCAGCSIFELWGQALRPVAQAELLSRLSLVQESAQASLQVFQLQPDEIWLER